MTAKQRCDCTEWNYKEKAVVGLPGPKFVVHLENLRLPMGSMYSQPHNHCIHDTPISFQSKRLRTAGGNLVQPFGGSAPLINAAYSRAGLSSWAEAPVVAGGQHRWQPPKAHVTLECCLSDVLVSLPYNKDPGTAQRFSELWAKAFQLARPSGSSNAASD